ncbi:MAG: hypothetical protein QOJ03_2394, partial [Frankiaceae bacterium]|nr:hypothetical protein [Frankiaceae bacterium]
MRNHGASLRISLVAALIAGLFVTVVTASASPAPTAPAFAA